MSELALQLIAKEKKQRTGKLDLGNCGLTDFPEELFELDWLEELSFNHTSVQYGDIRWNNFHGSLENNLRITQIPLDFGKLSLLKTLKLTGGSPFSGRGNITDCNALENLTCLQYLDLGSNQISDIYFLNKLTSLRSLKLYSNSISDISPLKSLVFLQTLNLDHNQIRDISALKNVTLLESLDIASAPFSYNLGIRDISSLENLFFLKSLRLGFNSISNISALNRLTSLQKLELQENNISDISFLENLTDLTALNIASNQIKNIRSLEKLSSLTSLNLSFNNIEDYSSLEKLINLSSLSLVSNQINNYNFLRKLPSLNSLNLSSNIINDYKFLENLSSLQTLDLSSTQINNFRFLEKLTALKKVDLSSNQISDIKGLVPLLGKGFSLVTKGYGEEGILIHNNQITTPPMTVIEQGSEAILKYFEQIEKQATETLHEARIVIVGEPDAGKTTLFRKLKDEKILVPDPDQKSTHGISINQERIFNHKNRENIKASIWDFGGQDTQNYLHQYFYAKDNLFVLVCDQRAEKTRFDYWFEMITRLCAESRIIVVRNLNERVTASQSLNLKEYEERFPGIRVSSVDVDFKVNDARWALLIQTIEENLSVMERVNQEIPRTWKPIRETIQQLKEEEKRCHITLEEFQNICSKNELPEEDYQNQCLDYLHWLGYALHYLDPSLINTIFIDPEWITIGLYEILREENYKPEMKGRFSQNDIQSIWKEKDYKVTDRNHLLNLLLKDRFEVCYKVEGSDNYLVPILINNEQKEPSKPESKPYTLRFKFPFMPFGFFSRLIVRLFDKIWDDYVWLTGVWLKDENKCMAKLEHFEKIIETGEEVFEISIYGEKKERKELLSEIRSEILHIRKQLFPNLIIEEQVPCFCEKCSTLKTPYFHSRNDLERMAERSQYLSQCKNSGELISTAQLLDSIIDTDELKRQYKEMGKEGININIKQKNKQVQKTKVKVDVKNEIAITINNILGEVQNLKEDFEDEKDLLLRHIDEVEYNVVHKEIEKAENAIQEIETSNSEGKPISAKAKSRLAQFIANLTDEKTTLGKCVKLLGNGVDFVSKLVGLYNQISLG